MEGDIFATLNNIQSLKKQYQLDAVDVSWAQNEKLLHLGLQGVDEVPVGEDGQLNGVLLEMLDLKLLTSLKK